MVAIYVNYPVRVKIVANDFIFVKVSDFNCITYSKHKAVSNEAAISSSTCILIHANDTTWQEEMKNTNFIKF
jgi:hypothetical protein